MSEILDALRRLGGADVVALLPTTTRGPGTAIYVHGLRTAGVAPLVDALVALDGMPLDALLPVEALPVAGQLEVCLDEEPPSPLARTLVTTGPLRCVGTTLVDGEAHLLGILLFLWQREVRLGVAELRTLRRRARPHVATLLRQAPKPLPSAAVLLDGLGRETHRTAAAEAWLDEPTVRAAIDECLSRLRETALARVDASVPGAAISARRLHGVAGCSMAVTFEALELPLVSTELLELSRLRRRIAIQVAAGLRIGEIAQLLGRGQETVRSHLRMVYRVLHIRGRADLGQRLALPRS